MNKTELAAEVAERLNGADPDARQYVDAVFDVIMRHVAAGERVQILGFGTFDSVGRAARVGRNPRTGAAIQVPAGVSPRFNAGQTFRAQVTGGSPAVSAVSAVVTDAEPAIAKPAKAKKVKAVSEKPTKEAQKKAAKPADRKAPKPAEKASKSPKSLKATKKSVKAGKAVKAGKK